MNQKYMDFLTQVKQIIPAERIYTDELRRLAWGTDAGFYRHIPQIVLRSQDENEVSAIVKLADSMNLPVTFRAAGTSLSGQAITDSILIVAGKNWEKYTVKENGNVITLQPGIVGQRVNDILAPYGRKMGPDPASIKSAMIGGIVNNNASGMNCGTHANSDKVLLSVRLVMADGTILDTGDKASREAFQQSHPDFIKRIEELRDRTRANKTLSERIAKKYSIKNVTGLNIRPFIAYDDPFDIMAHCIVGSEGTLAFLSEITMKTIPEETAKSTAMLYFPTLEEACHAVVAMKKLEDEDGPIVKSAEMLDYKSLVSVDDPIYLKFVEEMKATGGDVRGLTAVLTEVKCLSEAQKDKQKQTVLDCLKNFKAYVPFEFTEDPAVYSKFWAIRSGIFPSVGGQREPGTTCLIEDIAYPIDDLPVATLELQKMLEDYGYDDACIYGHALEGNYHFIINQSFNSEKETKRYMSLMKDVVAQVVDKYDGSLKAEHGTGRNMAPFVRHEWGDDAYQLMKDLKAVFDPKGLINQEVIFNDDPECFVKSIKPLPKLKVTDLDPDKEFAEQIYEKINKCIECGFCEVNCLTCGFTLSSRHRIIINREISRLRMTGEDPARLALLQKQYKYLGNATCAGDGLCSTSCPMGINVADLTHLIRQQEMAPGTTGYKIGNWAANNFSTVTSALRPVLGLANLGHTILGTTLMQGICNGLHAAGMPLWTPAMPKAVCKVPQNGIETKPEQPKVVYFPSCINQTMGLQKDAPYKEPLMNKMVSLLNKAGYEVIYPKNMKNLCCGTIWESKGMMDIADRKVKELEEALWEASEQGKYPVLCDQSPCLHRMRHCIKTMKLYEPAEFIWVFLKDRLKFKQTDRPVAVHVTCSTRLMGLQNTIINLAKLCSTKVVVPEGVGCCGFAGDRGFTHPEVNKYALRKLKPQLEENNIQIGYSNSRTCEIGLQTNTGVPYVSIAYLVDECTE